MKIDFERQYEFLQFDLIKAEEWAYRELKIELQRLLQAGHIRPETGVNPNAIGIPDVEGWCISREDKYWLVYLAERGKRSGVSIFTSPFDAANYFLWSRISHPKVESTTVGRLPRISC
ncbi:MAG: hypothetical protein ACOYB2_00185 [Limnohabitans sp.]|jgi:hypothetical protein